MAEVIDYSNNQIAVHTMDLVRRINEQIGVVHGKHCMLDLTPRKNGTFKAKSVVDGRDIEVRINATVPNDELFSISQRFVEPKFEEYQMLNVFAKDTSFNVGSETVGIDIISETGEAKIVAAGQDNPNITLTDINIGRRLQSVAQLWAGITVTRNQIQKIQMRNDRGQGPTLDFITRVMTAARRNMDRAHDDLIANGSHIEGLVAGNIPGLKDEFSDDSALYNGNAPSKGKAATVAAGATTGKLTWFKKNQNEIIHDLANMAGYLFQKTLFRPKVLMLPPELLVQGLALRTTTDNADTRPLVDWIRMAIKEGFKTDLDIIATNTMTAGSRSSTTRGNDWISDSAACLLDNDVENFAIAIVEPLTLLPSITDEFGTIRQNMTMKTGGLMRKQPGAATILYGVQSGTTVS
jgi:hypothetical protein